MSVGEAFLAYQKAGWPVGIDRGHINLALGEGWCVVVVEGEGRKAIERLAAANTTAGAMPKTLSIGSVSGAEVYLFRHKGSLRTALNLHGVTPGVHVWGAGRTVRLPPSESDDALGQVRWRGKTHAPTTLAVERVPELPAWLDEAARDPNAGRRAWDRVLTPSADATPCTDLGNAERLVRRHGRDLRWCGEWGTWLVWDGARWAKDLTGEVMRRAKETVRAIVDEAQLITQEDTRRKLLAHAVASEKASRIDAMIRLAQTEAGIPVTLAELDDRPFLLNCRNGTLDLRAGQLGPHRREDLLTRCIAVDYVHGARSEVWDRFLWESQGGSEAMVAFLQRAAGYSLTGDTREEKLFFVHGPPAAGKSTFLEAIKATLGEYAKTADFETFLAQTRGGGPNHDVARLAGARFVVSIEVDEGKRLAEGLVKSLTGGDTITARFLYQGLFEFRPAFKLWLAANHAPKVKDDDAAMWRRILRIPFERTVPKERRDPAVKATLLDREASGPAILAWLAEGCAAWLAGGLRVPQEIEQATEAYRAEMDPLAAFFSERVEFHPEATVARSVLREAYDTWVKEAGTGVPLSPKRFAERLRRKLAQELGDGWIPDTSVRIPTRHNPVDGWRGCRVLTDGPPARTLAAPIPSPSAPNDGFIEA
jgi:putative DNA primase/helicase